LKVLYQPNIMQVEVLQTTKEKIRGKGKNFRLVSTVENWDIRHSDVGEDQMQNATNAINLGMKQ